MKHIYTTVDLGCYADGAFGHQHCRDVLSNLVLDTIRDEFGPCSDYSVHANSKARELILMVESLRSEMSDDAGEEYDALDYLNANFCDGVYFDFREGELFCLSSSEVVDTNDNGTDRCPDCTQLLTGGDHTYCKSGA